MKHILSITALLFVLEACSTENDEIITFSDSKDRLWVGSDFWANRLQDWSLKRGKVLCGTTAPNRNLFLLTKTLDSSEPFEISAKAGSITTNKGGFGIRIGIKGKFDDYRDNAVRGKGIDFLLDTSGKFRVQSSTDTTYFDLSGTYSDSLQLSLRSHFSGIEIELKDLQNQVSETLLYPQSTQITGGIALVSDYETSLPYNQNPSAWFSSIRLSGVGIQNHLERAFGPIMFAQHILSNNYLKINAQMAPVDGSVALQCQIDGKWEKITSATIDSESRNVVLETEWTYSQDIPYRLVYEYTNYGGNDTVHYFAGKIRKEPVDKNEIVIAAFTGNNDLGFPNQDLVGNVEKQQPDFLFFSGDQIYERVGGFGLQRSPVDQAMLDYLRKWYLFGWTYRDIMRDIPTVSITDDHDVLHGNIWGESGKATPQAMQGTPAQDQGGYKMPAKFVNMVQRTQTDQLPDPYDPTPVLQDIDVYYTAINYGGISFAVLEDRKFKSAPTPLLPEGEIWNGWPQNKSYDIQKADIPEAQLLGSRQHDFLNEWVHDWSRGVWMKVVLSQTIFANVATLPEEEIHDQNVPKLRILPVNEYAPNDRKVTDMDSNGWPQSKRNEAIEIIRKGFAIHIAGDQHLGSTIQYGVDDYKDAGYAICVPSVSNVWPRRWYPPEEGSNPLADSPPYTGDYEDGFGNKMTVYAVSNPVFTGREPANLHDRATGYGIIKIKKNRDIILENWQRDIDPTAADARPYPGWPVLLNQFDNYKPMPLGHLSVLSFSGIEEPVLQVIHEASNEIIYSIRLTPGTFQPPVYKKGTYTIRIGDFDGEMQIFPGLEIFKSDTLSIKF